MFLNISNVVCKADTCFNATSTRVLCHKTAIVIGYFYKSGNQEKRKEKVVFSTAENKSGKGKGIQGKRIP